MARGVYTTGRGKFALNNSKYSLTLNYSDFLHK